jgi:hypothetical protein
MIQDITHTVFSQGNLSGNWSMGMEQPVAFGFAQSIDPSKPYPQYNYIGTGCYSSDDWAWYFRTPLWYHTIPCVPAFAFLLALWNMQSIKSQQDKLRTMVMVVLGCASFAGNSHVLKGRYKRTDLVWD